MACDAEAECIRGFCTSTLATDQEGPGPIAVDASHVYWVNEHAGTIVKARPDGSGVMKLADAPGATALALDGGYAYWGGTDVGKVPLNGGTPVTIATPTGVVQKIGVQDSSVYWLDDNGPERVWVDGSEQETFDAWASGSSFALTVDYAYWTAYGSNGFLYRTPLQGGMREYLAVAPYAYDFAVSGGIVYWTENYNPASVYALIDGRQTTLAYAYGATRAAADEEFLYWIEDKVTGTYSIERVSLPDGATDREPVVLLDAMATDLAVDANYLYWTDRNAGTLKRAPKVPAH